MPLYPWTKALHIISVMAWMAGMLYLPRLFVYHCGAQIGSDKSETFKVMERRLCCAIIHPSMIASFLFGGMLLITPGVIDWERVVDLFKAGPRPDFSGGPMAVFFLAKKIRGRSKYNFSQNISNS